MQAWKADEIPEVTLGRTTLKMPPAWGIPDSRPLPQWRNQTVPWKTPPRADDIGKRYHEMSGQKAYKHRYPQCKIKNWYRMKLITIPTQMVGDRKMDLSICFPLH